MKQNNSTEPLGHQTPVDPNSRFFPISPTEPQWNPLAYGLLNMNPLSKPTENHELPVSKPMP